MSGPDLDTILNRLSKSRFRSQFKLSEQAIRYIHQKGLSTIESHAKDLVEGRLVPRQPKNDGKQTPFRGHPVFVAQHATATCCRSCLSKWHSIPKDQELDDAQQSYVVKLVFGWIMEQLINQNQLSKVDFNRKKQQTLFDETESLHEKEPLIETEEQDLRE